MKPLAASDSEPCGFVRNFGGTGFTHNHSPQSPIRFARWALRMKPLAAGDSEPCGFVRNFGGSLGGLCGLGRHA